MGILRGLKDPRAVRPLLDALAWDVEKDVAYGVAGVLEELGDPQAVDALVDAALDVRRPLARRREAAEALAAFKDARSVEALNRLVKEKGFELVTAYGLFRLTGDDKAAERLEQALQGEEQPAEVVRLLAKCDDPRVEQLLLVAVAEAPRRVRPPVVALLKARYWATSRARVKEVLLKEAESPNVSDFALAELGELGGEDVAERLLALVEVLKGKRWAKAARALARTGDPRAVRYFSKSRILEKDPGRRRLAAELLEEAAARRAQLERAKRG
jgi:HEAT repeat protein